MSNFTIKTDGMKWRAAVQAASTSAARVLAEQMHNDSNHYIPKQENTLRDSFRMENGAPGEVLLVWQTPYALYQWYGCFPDGSHVIVNHTTPGTETHWVDRAKEKRADVWQKVLENAFKAGFK